MKQSILKKQKGVIKTRFVRIPKPMGASQFRASLKTSLAKAKKEPIIISEQRGGDAFVVLSVQLYNELVEAWEDAMDGAELARLIEQHKRTKGKLIPLKSIK